ncbi:MAG: hypothetical protein MZV65_18945 [Chromatiales bacterium]|nr:hypothetical protein [Chromatiales bacterium]
MGRRILAPLPVLRSRREPALRAGCSRLRLRCSAAAAGPSAPTSKTSNYVARMERGAIRNWPHAAR